jgi:hypothetical protein
VRAPRAFGSCDVEAGIHDALGGAAGVFMRVPSSARGDVERPSPLSTTDAAADGRRSVAVGALGSSSALGSSIRELTRHPPSREREVPYLSAGAPSQVPAPNWTWR